MVGHCGVAGVGGNWHAIRLEKRDFLHEKSQQLASSRGRTSRPVQAVCSSLQSESQAVCLCWGSYCEHSGARCLNVRACV